MPRFDPLMAFVEWFQTRSGIAMPLSPADGVSRVGAFSGIVLYRDRHFQVQLWICDPNSFIPEHSHPNVDSIQVYVSGQVYLTKNGKPVIQAEDLQINENGLSSQLGAFLRVDANETHGAQIGPMGGAFLTFQHFHVGEPVSVEQVWEGPPLSLEHGQTLDNAA